MGASVSQTGLSSPTDPSRDAALANALSRREEIERQLPALKAELRRLDHFIVAWFEMAGEPIPAALKRQAGGRSGSRVVNPPKEEVAAAAVAILSERGQPMMRSELLAALNSRGFILNGKDPAMVLSTMLWRCQDRVTRTRAGYVPAQSKGESK